MQLSSKIYPESTSFIKVFFFNILQIFSARCVTLPLRHYRINPFCLYPPPIVLTPTLVLVSTTKAWARQRHIFIGYFGSIDNYYKLSYYVCVIIRILIPFTQQTTGTNNKQLTLAALEWKDSETGLTWEESPRKRTAIFPSRQTYDFSRNFSIGGSQEKFLKKLNWQDF